MRTKDQVLQGERIEELEIRCALSFKLFRLRVLGRPNHADFHEIIYRLIHKYQRCVIKLPRQHTKTSTVQDYILWRMYYDKNLDILFLSHGKEGATDNLTDVTEMIEDNELLKEKLAPADRKYSWSKTLIRTLTGCKIYAKANNRRVKGGAYNIVFPDEVGEYTDKSNYFEVVEPTINTTQGKIIAVGTPQTKFDLLAELEDNPLYAKYGNPCIISDSKGNPKPLWDFKYTLAIPDDPKSTIVIEDGIPKTSLPRLKQMYEAAGKLSKWMTEMMVTPVSGESAVFPDDIIEANLDRHEKFEPYADRRFIYYNGADYAMSQKAQADFNAWLTGKWLTAGKLKLVNVYHAKGTEEETKNQYKEWYWRFGTHKACIDNSSWGRTWLPEFQKDNMACEGYDFKSKGQTRQELLQIVKDALFDKRLIIPYNSEDIKARIIVDELISQLQSFREEYDEQKREIIWKCTARHDDLVIGLGLLLKAAGINSGKVDVVMF